MKQYFIAAILMASFPVDVISAPIDSHVTAETREVYNVLHDVSRANRVLVGKHNPTLFGVYGGHPPYWTYDYNGRKQAWMFNPGMAHSNHTDELCDPCALTNDFPAVAGFDFSMIGSDIEDAFVYLFQRAHERGAILTFSFHSHNLVTDHGAWISGDDGAYHSIRRLLPGGDHYHAFQAKMDEIADFTKRHLVDSSGRPIPVIFRPWHEADGGWFWWGRNNDAHNTADDIKQLYQNTVTYLRDQKGIHNFLYAFSPDCGGSGNDEDIYPGDAYVDIIGTDCYFAPNRGTQYVQGALDQMVQMAQAHGKIPAMTETGVIQEALTNHPSFFTQELLSSLTSSAGMRAAYMLTWANQRSGDGNAAIYDAFPGHPLEQDYMAFYNDPKTYFLSDLKSHYRQLYN